MLLFYEITVLGCKALLLKPPKLFLNENLSKVIIAISKMADFVDDPSFLQQKKVDPGAGKVKPGKSFMSAWNAPPFHTCKLSSP